VDSKWQGWAAMAGILMVIIGGFKAFTGFIGLFLVFAGLAAVQMKAWGSGSA
jgi:hypothetical protein